MGIFNTKIFDELEDGLKRLSKRIKTNIEDDNKKNIIQKMS